MPKITDQSILDRNALRIFGCTNADAVALNDGHDLRCVGSAAMRYATQRAAAAKRCIDWRITFAEWRDVWNASGHWQRRGIGRGAFCMARHGDTGPYEVGNVSIKTCVENSREGIERARPAMQANPVRHGLGKGRGWTFIPGRNLPFQVVVARRYVGCFGSQSEAEAAYAVGVRAHRESFLVRSLNGLFLAEIPSGK